MPEPMSETSAIPSVMADDGMQTGETKMVTSDAGQTTSETTVYVDGGKEAGSTIMVDETQK